MKVLFVYSGNNSLETSPSVKAQIDSIKNEGVEVDEIQIKGKGFVGYLKNVSKIRRAYKNENYDIIHAHYSLTGFVASMAGCRPLVVSLMGSDVFESKFVNLFNKIFNFFIWDYCIVKSQSLKDALGMKECAVIPNGVNTNLFYRMDKDEARKKLGWEYNKPTIIFVSDPKRPEKNYKLLKESVEFLNDSNDSISIKIVHGIKQPDLKLYYNAADVLALPSLWEGSPNVIKEAMACGCPIVATDIGDVKWLTKSVDGCFVSENSLNGFAANIKDALIYAKHMNRTNGIERINELNIDSISTAKRIVYLYKQIAKK